MNVGEGKTISQSTPPNFRPQFPHRVLLSLLSVVSSPSGLYMVLKHKCLFSALGPLHTLSFSWNSSLSIFVWSLLFILFFSPTTSSRNLADCSLLQPLSYHFVLFWLLYSIYQHLKLAPLYIDLLILFVYFSHSIQKFSESNLLLCLVPYFSLMPSIL